MKIPRIIWSWEHHVLPWIMAFTLKTKFYSRTGTANILKGIIFLISTFTAYLGHFFVNSRNAISSYLRLFSYERKTIMLEYIFQF